MIRLHLFGTVELRREDTTASRGIVLQPKRLALLAYLAAGPRDRHRRDTVVGMFWPELDSERARAALSKALHYLRRSLGDGVLITYGDEELRVEPTQLWCDVTAFEQSLEGDRQAEALGHYHGDLLEGFFLSDAPGFEHWVEVERDRLRRRAAAAAWKLADAAESDGNPVGAIDWARRARLLSPEDEAGLRRLLTLLEQAGDRAGAMREYEAFARHLAQEYELDPSPETQALIARAREARPASAPSPSHHSAEQHRSVGVEGGTPAPVHSAPSAPVTRARVESMNAVNARLAVVGAVLILALAGAAYLWPRGTGQDLDPQRVVVAPFENRTGEPSLDPVGHMATDWIIQGLAHTGLVRVVPFTATFSSARFALGITDPTDSAERVQALARETGAGIVIAGSYYLQGDSLVLHTRIMDAIAGTVLQALDPVSTSRSRPLVAVEAVRQRVMAGLAPHVDPRMSDYARIISRTPSPEAYREYAEGMQQFLATDWQTALEHFSRAVAYDSVYTLPLVLSAIAYANLGDYAAVDSVARLVEPHGHQLAEYDRLALTAATAWGRGDYATSHQAAKRVAELAPNTIVHGQVAKELLMLNRPREALEVFEQLDPQRGELRGWFVYWQNLATAHHLLGDHRRELRVARRARELYPDNDNALRLELRALAAAGRVADVRRALDDHFASPAPGQLRSGILLRETALELRAHGHADEARELLVRSLDWYRSRPADLQVTIGMRRALVEAHYLAGRWEEARQSLIALAFERPDDVAVQGRLGTLAARQGDRAEAERILAWLTALERPYLLGEHTYWRARIAALLGEPERAVGWLQEAYAQGRSEWIGLHSDPDLESLHDFTPFRRLVRPKG
jgi:DNA-binding SARP family transcriptional activator/TolB-like protein/predicted Zn-dependent protease